MHAFAHCMLRPGLCGCTSDSHAMITQPGPLHRAIAVTAPLIVLLCADRVVADVSTRGIPRVLTLHDFDGPDAVGALRTFFRSYCGRDCAKACGMLSGTWNTVSPVAPYPVITANATQCEATCSHAAADSFCNVEFLDSHCSNMGPTGAATFVWQEGTTPNATAPQCTYGLNAVAYVELDTSGRMSLVRQFYDPAEYADGLAYCPTDLMVGQGPRVDGMMRAAGRGGAAPARVRVPQPHTHTSSDDATRHLEENADAVDDTNATALCLGMLADYSRRRCDRLGLYVAPNFRFEFPGAPVGGVDLAFFENNCAAPKPPEWITVQESFVENRTAGYFWDFYATSSQNPKTKKPCAVSLPESYRCLAVDTPAGLRLSYVHDTFDPVGYTAWATSCDLPGARRR